MGNRKEQNVSGRRDLQGNGGFTKMSVQELDAVTSRKRKTQRPKEETFTRNIRTGTETCSRNTEREEGLEEEVFAHFFWRVKKVWQYTWRSAVKDRRLKPTPSPKP